MYIQNVLPDTALGQILIHPIKNRGTFFDDSYDVLAQSQTQVHATTIPCHTRLIPRHANTNADHTYEDIYSIKITGPTTIVTYGELVHAMARSTIVDENDAQSKVNRGMRDLMEKNR